MYMYIAHTSILNVDTVYYIKSAIYRSNWFYLYVEQEGVGPGW